MYGEIVTRLRYKPTEIHNTFLTINGTEASLSINPPEIPFPVLSEYEYCTIFLESFETNKDTLYEVKYEIHYKWNELLYKIGEVTSVNGKAEFPRLIKGMSYYVTAVPLDGKYQSKQVRITLDEYDIRQEPVAITTYENSDYKNYDHYLILKNIFGDANVYLEGNPDYISLDRNDKNLRVYLNKDATERASEFDLIIEDYRIEDIIVSRKTISVNDGFSSPYDISIEFTDSNAAIFRWKADGEYSINKFYISNSINDKEIPTDVIDTSTYIITNYDNSKTHYLWISSIRDGKEKISDPVTIDSFDKSINPLIGPLVDYSINQNNDLVVNLSHISSNVDNYSVYISEDEITNIDDLKPVISSTFKNIVIPNFDVYNNYDRTLKLATSTNKYNHSYIGDNKDLYVAYDWTPDNLNCQIYLNAEDVMETNVSAWKDRKTKIDFIQTSEDKKPTMNIISNKKAIVFDGNDILTTNNSSITTLMHNKSNSWIFAIYRQNGIYESINVHYRNVFRFSAINGTSLFALFASSPNYNYKPTIGTRRIVSDTGNFCPATSGKDKDDIKFIYGNAKYNDELTNFEIYVNGLLENTLKASFEPGLTSNDTAYCDIGGSNINIPEAFKGEIFAIVMGNNEISTLERQKLEGWAAHKYGLVNELPNDHPYKTRRPIIDHSPSFTYEILEDE